jgi:putative hydrolase of the HAD superfamily
MVKNILFDLDSTLYSAGFGLEKRVRERIYAFTAAYLGLSVKEAEAERGKNMDRYVTCLEWLTAEHGLTDIDSYFLAIHPENEADALVPDTQLRPFLKSLPAPLSILTNSSLVHTKRLLKILGVEDCFTRIFDICWNQFQGKPRPEVFKRTLAALNAEAGETLFIDDDRRHIDSFCSMGGRGILFDEFDAYPDYPHDRIRELKELNRFL